MSECVERTLPLIFGKGSLLIYSAPKHPSSSGCGGGGGGSREKVFVRVVAGYLLLCDDISAVNTKSEIENATVRRLHTAKQRGINSSKAINMNTKIEFGTDNNLFGAQMHECVCRGFAVAHTQTPKKKKCASIYILVERQLTTHWHTTLVIMIRCIRSAYAVFTFINFTGAARQSQYDRSATADRRTTYKV